jgi:hypothetical protein
LTVTRFTKVTAKEFTALEQFETDSSILCSSAAASKGHFSYKFDSGTCWLGKAEGVGKGDIQVMVDETGKGNKHDACKRTKI